SGGSMRWRWRPGSGWAMIQRSRATQDARAGEVSAEGIEKMGFAILDFARSARETRFAGSKTAPGRRMRLAVSQQSRNVLFWERSSAVWRAPFPSVSIVSKGARSPRVAFPRQHGAPLAAP